MVWEGHTGESNHELLRSNRQVLPSRVFLLCVTSYDIHFLPGCFCSDNSLLVVIVNKNQSWALTASRRILKHFLLDKLWEEKAFCGSPLIIYVNKVLSSPGVLVKVPQRNRPIGYTKGYVKRDLSWDLAHVIMVKGIHLDCRFVPCPCSGYMW